jgi:hypothetical protein
VISSFLQGLKNSKQLKYQFGDAASYFLEHGRKRHDSKAIWRSFVDASMMPPFSVYKRNAGAPRRLHRKSPRAGGYSLQAGGRDLLRSVSVGGSVQGEQLQGQLG